MLTCCRARDKVTGVKRWRRSGISRNCLIYTVVTGSDRVAGNGSGALRPFVEDFHRIDEREILARHQRNHELVLVVRPEPLHPKNERTVGPGALKQIEIALNRNPVHEYVENAASRAAASRQAGADPAFRHVQVDRVAPGRNRNRISQIAKAFAGPEAWIGGSFGCFG